nr:DUF2868 domain-containing protein [uncultured Desulfobulbus sp.]
MSRLWNIADLLDLHFFSRLDDEVQRTQGDAGLAKRDRVIYLTKIEPQIRNQGKVAPRMLIRLWLTTRRQQFQSKKESEDQPLPGNLWQELVVLGRGLILLLGVLMGGATAGALLLYTGTTPLNISLYLGILVVSQLIMVFLQGCLLLYRSWRRLPLESTSLYVILGRAMLRLLERVRGRLYRRLSGKQRLDLSALVGSIQQRRELGVLLVWPAFILVQLGAIGFNLGALLATLSKVTFSDMAFAWQSSLQLSPELVAQIVHLIALPWSWLFPQAVPTLAEIQGSQMVLKEGITHLASTDLVSWWPFLCWSVVLYGLLPRCVLLAIGCLQQRQALEALNFGSLNFRPLLRRMTAPKVDTSGVHKKQPVSPASKPVPEPEVVTPKIPSPPDTGALSKEELSPNPVPELREEEPEAEPEETEVFESEELVFKGAVHSEPEPLVPAEEQGLILIPDELFEECPQADLLTQLKHTYPNLCMQLQCYDETDSVAALHLEPNTLDELFLLLEAWQPPLKETESFLRGLRINLGRDFPITILLIGKPTPATMLTSVDGNQLGIWQMKMQALGDGNLAVQPLILP